MSEKSNLVIFQSGIYYENTLTLKTIEFKNCTGCIKLKNLNLDKIKCWIKLLFIPNQISTREFKLEGTTILFTH